MGDLVVNNLCVMLNICGVKKTFYFQQFTFNTGKVLKGVILGKQ